MTPTSNSAEDVNGKKEKKNVYLVKCSLSSYDRSNGSYKDFDFMSIPNHRNVQARHGNTHRQFQHAGSRSRRILSVRLT